MTNQDRDWIESPLFDGICDSPLALSPNDSVAIAIAQMTAASNYHSPPDHQSVPPLCDQVRAHCAVVVDQAQIVGVLTSQELFQFQTRGQIASEHLVQEIMQPDFVRVTLRDSRQTVQRQLVERGAPCAVVADDQGGLIGIITPATLLAALEASNSASQTQNSSPASWTSAKQSRPQHSDLATSEPEISERIPEGIYQALFDQSVLGIALSRLDTEIPQPLHINQKLCELLGYSRDALMTMSFMDIIPPEDLPIARESIQRLLAHPERGQSVVHRFMRRDGSVFWAQVTLTLLSGVPQYPPVKLVLIEDISDRKALEAELSGAFQKMGAVLDSADVGIVRLRFYRDTSIEYDYISPNCEKNFGYTEAELKNNSDLWRSRIHPDDWASSVLPAMHALLSDHSGKPQTVTCEYRYQRKDGSTCWLLGKCQGHWMAAGGYWSVTVVDTDISHQKIAEAELQATTARLRNIVESMHDWVWEIDANGITTYCGPQVQRLLGYEPKDLMGRSFEVFMDPAEATRVAAIFQQLAANRDSFLNLAATLRHKNGQPVMIESSGAPILDSEGNCCGFVGVDRDVSDIRRAAQKLDAYNQLLVKTARNEPLATVLQASVHTAQQLLDTSAATLFLLDETAHLKCLAATDFPPALSQLIEASDQDAAIPCAAVTQRQEPLICADLRADERWPGYGDLALDYGFQSVWSYPLTQADGSPLGAFALYYREPRSPQPTKLDFMAQLANIAEIAITKAQTTIALQDSEDYYRCLFNQSSAGIFTTRDGHFIDANVRGCELLGYSRAELLTKSVADITHPDDMVPIVPIQDQLMTGETSFFTQEKRYIRKDGSQFWGSLEVVLVRDQSGAPKCYMAVVYDITSRKLAEQQRQESEARFRAIFDNMYQFIGLLSTDGVVLEVNQAALDSIQQPREAIVGQLIWETPWWEISQTAQARLRAAVSRAAQGKFIRYECECYGANKTLLTLDFSLRPLINDQGEVVLLIPEGRDCTEAKRLEAEREHLLTELQNSEQRLQRLVAGTARTTGEDFFPALVQNLAEALAVEYSLVAELIDCRLETLAFWAHGALQANFSHEPALGPCGRALQDAQYFCRDAVQSWFPDDDLLAEMGVEGYLGLALESNSGEAMGVLCIMSARPLQVLQNYEPLLQIFAARAAAELERQRTESALKSIVEGTAALTGPDFFAALVRHIAEALRVSHVFISEAVEGDRLRFLAAWGDGEYLPNDTVDAIGTTCAVALREGSYHCDRDVIARFPHNPRLPAMQVESYQGIALKNRAGRAIGTLCVFARRPLLIPDRSEQTLRVFAARATAELERLHAQTALESLNQALEARVERRTAALLAQESRYRALMSAARDMIGIVDLDGNVLEANPVAARLLGYSQAELTSLNLAQLHAPEDLLFLQTQHEKLMHGEITSYACDLDFVCKDGSRLPTSCSVSLVDVDGTPLMMGVFRDIRDRKQAEAQLQALSDRLELAIRSAEIGIWEWNFQTQHLTWDARMFEIYGVQPANFQHRYEDFVNCVHPEDLGKIEPETFEENNNFATEFRIVRPDGTIRHVFSTALIQTDSSGQPARAVGVNLDITARKLAEEHLRASEQRYATLAATVPVGLYRFDPRGRCTYINQRLSQITGFSMDAALGSGWPTILHPADRDRVLAQWQQTLQQQCPFEMELRLQHADGRVVWIYEYCVPERDASGRVIGYVGTVTDISDRKQAELALQQLSQKLSLALNSGSLGYWEWNILTNEVTWDEKLYEFHGLTQLPLSYERFRKTVHDEDIELLEQLVQHAVAGDCDYHNALGRSCPCELIYRAVHQDGTITFIKAYGVVLRDHQNQPTSMLGVSFDVTDFKATQEQLTFTNIELARATRLKDEFLANMSHELRTPMNAILGNTEAILEGIYGEVSRAQQNALATIESSGHHLLRLINEILDLAKIESGQIRLYPGAINLKVLCEESILFIRQQATKKRLQVNLHVSPQVPVIAADELRIRQVIINLLNNAVKFTPEGGAVSLRVLNCIETPAAATSDEQWLRVMVTDTGIGIHADDLSKLFQPFVQVDGALNRQHEGTGLGLALVKRIVELHGGQVGVQSTVGAGSQFWFDLPYQPVTIADQSALTADSTIETETRNPPSPPLTVLIAEDNPQNAEMLTLYLQNKGYTVLLASDGQRAIDLVQSEQPDIVLMDVQMPGVDGLEAIRQIRQRAECASLPIIALTALAMAGDRERCLAAGATAYHSKPFKLKELTAQLELLCAAASD
ncbi:MAG: PAS domain S-box protein [Leptolyngbyaceae cyanobacterium]